MKELTIEEKAKRYDEVVDRLRYAFNSNRCTLGFMNEILHYPRESEDERVKQKIIKLIKKSNEVGGYALHKWEADEMLVWLEKQGNPTNDDMKEALRTEYEKGRADAFAQMQKEWSEEDECTLNGILDDYKSMCKTYRNWLESLRNRIQPQQKQEWGEENEKKQKKNY